MGVAKSGVHRRLLRIVNNPKIYRIRHDDLGLTLSSPSVPLTPDYCSHNTWPSIFSPYLWFYQSWTWSIHDNPKISFSGLSVNYSVTTMVKLAMSSRPNTTNKCIWIWWGTLSDDVSSSSIGWWVSDAVVLSCSNFVCIHGIFVRISPSTR